MRRILSWIFGCLGILLVGALIAPFFLNLNPYKPLILEKSREALGRDVAIDGDLSLSLLPRPQITIHRLRIGNVSGGSPHDFCKVERIRASAAFLPLLKKQVKLTSVELDHPQLFLEKNKEGKNNWTFTFPSTAQESPSSFEVAIDKVSLNDGLVTYQEAGRITSIQAINIHTALEPTDRPSTVTATLKAFDQDFKLEGKFKPILEEQEVAFKVQAGKTTSRLQGKLLLSSPTFKGSLDTEIDPQLVKDLLPQNPALPFLTSPWHLQGKLIAGAEMISLQEAKLNIGSAHPTGNVAVFLKNGLQAEANLENLPGEGLCQLTYAASPQGAHGKVNTAFRQPQNFLRWLGIKDDGLPPELRQALSFSTHYILEDKLHLKNMNFTLKDAKVSGDVSWKIQDGNPWLHVNLESPKVENVFKLAAISTPILGVGKLKGTLAGDMDRLKLVTTLGLGDISLVSRGTVSHLLKIPTLDVHLLFSHPNLKSFLGNMGNTSRVGAGKVTIDSHLQGTPTAFSLTGIKGNLGSDVYFTGNMTVANAGAKPKLKLALSLNTLNLDALLAMRETGYQPYSEGKVYFVSARKPESLLSRGANWPHTPLDFGFLHKFDGEFDIKASHLNQKDIHVSAPHLTAKVQNGRLDMTSLVGILFGGQLTAKGYLTAENACHVTLALKEANLKGIVPLEGRIKIIEGKLSLSGDLSTRGQSVDAMVRQLTGPVTIQARDGVISGFDLPALSQRLGNLQNPQSLLTLFTTAMGKGKTPFSSFKGDIRFHKGVGTIQSMNLVAKGGEGKATGSINLPNYSLDVRSEFRLTEHPNLPPFRMHLVGPLDNPSRNLETSHLQKYMMENVFKGIIGKIGKDKIPGADILSSLLGGEKKGAPQGGQPQQNKSPTQKPEQIVKDIFKGLF